MTRWTTALMALLLIGVLMSFRTASAEEARSTVMAGAEAPLPESSNPSDVGTSSGAELEGESGAAEEESEPSTLVDTAHESISSGVLATARWLDSFFADPRIENETSKTRVRVRYSVFAEEGNDVEYNVRANLRLDLPVLKDKLHLMIAGDPEDDDDFRALSGRQGEGPELISSDDDFSASLRYFLVDTIGRNISLRTGVRWRDGMPVFFLEPRYRQSVLRDPWLFRFTQRVIGYTDGETGVRTTFDLERKLRRPYFFRTSLDGSWASDEHGYFYSLAFSIYRQISPRRVLIYGWSNAFQTRPNHRLENVTLSVRYRQRILRDWLFYEIIPQVSFPHEEDHAVTPGILLRLEMLFGHYPALPEPPR